MSYPASTTVTISSKGQVVIPKDFRIAIGLESGARLVIACHTGGTLELRPLHNSIKEIFGFVKEKTHTTVNSHSTDDDVIAALVVAEDKKTKTKKKTKSRRK